jgi:hypothetical protein
MLKLVGRGTYPQNEEGNPMKNREIRREAWALFKKNYLKMLPGIAVICLVFLGQSLLLPQFVPNGLIGTLAPLIGTVLFAPITLAGAADFFLAIRRGGAPEIGRLFAHIQNTRQVLNIWLAALVYGGAVLGINLIRAALAGMTLPNGAVIALGVLTLALLVPGIWLTFRLQLFSYAAAMDPDAGAIDWLHTSWRQMEGNCGRSFCLSFSTGWPYLLFWIAVVFILGLVGTPGTRPVSSPAFSVFTSVSLWLYMGYSMLALAVFADDLLSKKIAKKAGKRQSIDAHPKL